jgi:predicted GIY-YIG superfamily endonuclease
MSTEAPTQRWNCYLLVTNDGGGQRTYVGVTPDLDRRLAQHNREQSGGAAATAGRHWHRVCHVKGFPDKRAVLQFEWRWKQLSRPPKQTGPPLERRLRGLQALLALDRPTTAATPYAEYATPLEVVWEAEGVEIPTL